MWHTIVVVVTCLFVAVVGATPPASGSADEVDAAEEQPLVEGAPRPSARARSLDGPPLIATPPSTGPAAYGTADASSATTTDALDWTVRAATTGTSLRFIDASAFVDKVLYGTPDGIFVEDTEHRRVRVDTYADGTPLPDDVIDAAISADGSTVALLRYSLEEQDMGNEPRVRVIRLDSGENWEKFLPDAGRQVWSTGSSDECSYFTRRGPLKLSARGDVLWFATSPCFFDSIFVLDIAEASANRWRFVDAFRQHARQITADGKRAVVGWDFYIDGNWSGGQDPDEPLQSESYSFDLEYTNDSGVRSRNLDWPPFFLHFHADSITGKHGPGMVVVPDGTGSRFLATTNEIGLDPDTVIYESGRQLYLLEDREFRSLGTTRSWSEDQFRLSSSGRHALHTVEDGVERLTLDPMTARTYPRFSIPAVEPALKFALRSRTADASSSAIDIAELGTVNEDLCPGGLLRLRGDRNCDQRVRVAVVGDSYIAGEGAGEYQTGTDVHAGDRRNLCHRSPESWGFRLAESLVSASQDVAFTACSGATTLDFVHGRYSEPGQLERLGSHDPDVVFVSLGGNDVPFEDLILSCVGMPCLAIPGWTGAKMRAATAAADKVQDALHDIRSAAPHAVVYLAGYPPPVSADHVVCPALVPAPFQVDVLEVSWFERTFAPHLNRELQKAAANAGVHFLDLSAALAGHEICSADELVNGLTLGDDRFVVVGNESFHPTAEGYARIHDHIVERYGSVDALAALDNPAPTADGVIVTPGPSGQVTFEYRDGNYRLWGDRGEVTVVGAEPNTLVAIGMYSTPKRLATGVTDTHGMATLPFSLPPGIPPGPHTVVVYAPETAQLLVSDVVPLTAAEECAWRDGDVDGDGDGLADRCDSDAADGPLGDSDGDEVINGADNCPSTPNPEQRDADRYGFGDACDPAGGHDLIAGWRPVPAPPHPPGSVRGLPLDRAVTVTWSPASVDDGPPVTRYTVTAHPGDGTCETDGALSCVIAGLANGQPYTFQVQAHSAAGASAVSEPSNAASPRAARGLRLRQAPPTADDDYRGTKGRERWTGATPCADSPRAPLCRPPTRPMSRRLPVNDAS